MLSKILTWGVKTVVGGPAKSWVFTSGAMMLFNFVKKQTGRTEMIDLSNTRPGDKIVIEHLNVTHGQQMKEHKALAKADKRDAKHAKKQRKAERKARRRS